MKTLSYLVSAIFFVAAFCSCGGNSSSRQEAISVQKEFFGASFGDSQSSTIQTLKDQGFNLDETDNNAGKLRWSSAKENGRVKFGNKEWDRFTTIYYGNKLGEIRFYLDCQDNDDEAKEKYNELEKTLAGKYGEFAEVKTSKKNIVQQKDVVCSDGKIVLTLQKLEDREQGSVSKFFGTDYIYQIALSYVSQESIDKANDEF